MTIPSGAIEYQTLGSKLRRRSQRLVGAEQAGNGGVAERETRGGGADEERAAAEIGGLAFLFDFHVLVHVGLRSVPALDAVRMSAAARMMAFWMRE